MQMRTERGQAATGEREVIRLAVGTALVGSKSEPGAWHRVESYRCDCKSFEHRGRCAHVTALHDAEIRAGVRTVQPETTVVVVVVEKPVAVRMCRDCDAPAEGGPYCRKHSIL